MDGERRARMERHTACYARKFEILKCSLHVLTFQFKADVRPISVSGNESKTLIIKDTEMGKEELIKSLSINQDHKTLEHYKAPSKQKRRKDNLTSTTQLELLKSKATPITRTIAMSLITRYREKIGI